MCKGFVPTLPAATDDPWQTTTCTSTNYITDPHGVKDQMHHGQWKWPYILDKVVLDFLQRAARTTK
jgi:hypothetical protein